MSTTITPPLPHSHTSTPPYPHTPSPNFPISQFPNFLISQFPRLRVSLSPLLILFAVLTASVSAAAAADAVWLEGEAPTTVTPTDFKPNVNGWGHPEYLSQGKWLDISIDANKIDQQLPTGSVSLSYNFNAPRDGNYAIWNRIGFERIRSPFDWRVDGGAWSTILPTQNTVDVEELATWNPIAWLNMGTVPLTAGPHTLGIRISKSKDDKGATANLKYDSDAICINPNPFIPNGPRKPGDTTGPTAEDRAAAEKVFQMTMPAGPAQTALSLNGDWQIAPDDELVVQDRTGPITSLPQADQLLWQSVPVPSDRSASRPELTYVHRYFERARVQVPAQMAGHSLYLHFPSVSMIATAFVNGQQVGFTKAPYALWDIDVTRAIKPGQVNEIWLGLKDAFYGLADAANAGHPQYVPYDFWHYNTTNQLDFPVLSHYQTGILLAPSLVVAGKSYTSDVFAMPSVKQKSLGLQITVNNPSADNITVQVLNQVVPLEGGPAAKTFAPQPLQVPAGQEKVITISEGWTNPKLWWPDDPRQYNVITRLSLNGQPIDERTTKFGFREWDWHGPTFSLNGIPWHGRADLFAYGQADEAAVAAWRKHGMNMERLWGETSWGGKTIEDALDFYDSHGVPIRRTGIFDGEGAAGFYNLTEHVRQGGKDVTVARQALFDNWRTQLAAWVKSQRNHPSIFIWSMENEITFINASVFGLNPYTDPEMKKAADMLAQIDPTRPQMTDGGNALLDQSLPVYGGHYMAPPIPTLPEGAYDMEGYRHRQKWPITGIKPILFGEDFFASGVDLSELATIGGEAAFVGKAESHPAVGEIARMLSEGYRWNGISFHFWFGGETNLHYIAWQPVAVLCREWDWSFNSGQPAPRTLAIFNDTHYADPITFTWTLQLGGKKIATKTAVYKVAPGTRQIINMALPVPSVTTRQEGKWTLALDTRGQRVFTDIKDVSVLPEATVQISSPRTVGSGSTLISTPRIGGGGGELLVYDPYGSVIKFLRSRGVAFTALQSLKDATPGGKVLIVGKDALTPQQSTSSALAAYAAGGRTVIVLEQENPLRYTALPGEMNPDTSEGAGGEGYVAFGEDMTSPILSGLEQKDFFTWGPDGAIYRNAYLKPTSGGKSLVQCGKGLQDTALAEMQAGKGILLVSQLVIGEKITSSPVAQHLLANMINYGAHYRQVFYPVRVDAPENPQLTKALDATGLRYSKAADPLEAISKPGTIAILDASPANIHTLAGNLPKVNAFTAGGGWIILNNLTPAALDDYNRLVGYNHLIRPFKQEKVAWPITRNPLTAGLATSNIVMGSGKQIFNFAAGQYPDTDAFSYVVDYDEIAPFCTSSFFAWNNITNNYTMADGFWPLIINFPVPKDGSPYNVPITLPRPETVKQFTWVSDLNYAGTTKIGLLFDGKDRVTFPTQPNGDPQTFPIVPPRKPKQMTLQILDWQHIPAKQHDGQDLVGIDNVYIKVARPPDFYQKVKPMLNIGAMMEYPRGPGGLVLCNVKYKDTETVPENAVKKQTIMAAILRNLHAPFSGGKTIIAGASNLRYTSIDISKKANQFRGEQGWFGDKNFPFTDLPGGAHTLAGVPYNIYQFSTSIVPTTIMLGGNGIPGNLPEAVAGIPVDRKADALFFLQTARIDQPRNQDDIKHHRQFEMADYIIHYADGQTAKVPIYSEFNVDNYKQENPTAIPGAQIAWTAPYAGTKFYGVAYSMQWNNPRPDVPIQSIDLVYGPDRRGIPALFALTAATAQ